ncbi:MAG: hypothetical protein V1883_01470 [Candidatus Omnitrophota bacterium]
MRVIKTAILLIALVIALPFWALSQSDAPEFQLSIEEYLNNALPPQEGRIVNFNDITGILTVTDTPSNQQLIQKLVTQFDIGPKQILIEARFVEIEFEDLDELGIEWFLYEAGDVNINPGGANTQYQNIRWDNSGTDTFPQTELGLDIAIVADWAKKNFIEAYLHALASQNRANLLSAPKITTLSGQQANIQVTQTIPYVTDVQFENSGTAEHPIWKFDYTIEEKMTGITLEVTPYVGSNSDIITLDIHPEVSNLKARRPIFEGASTAAANPITYGMSVPALLGWPVIDTRTVQTSVMVKSGSTLIMGGFINDDDSTTEKKVPILGDIPLIGPLFRYQYVDRKKKNLVIFLTATLLTAEGETAQ